MLTSYILGRFMGKFYGKFEKIPKNSNLFGGIVSRIHGISCLLASYDVAADYHGVDNLRPLIGWRIFSGWRRLIGPYGLVLTVPLKPDISGHVPTHLHIVYIS